MCGKCSASSSNRESVARWIPLYRFCSQSLEELEREDSSDSYTRERLRDMADFFDTINAAYTEVSQISPKALRTALKVRGKLRKVLRVTEVNFFA